MNINSLLFFILQMSFPSLPFFHFVLILFFFFLYDFHFCCHALKSFLPNFGTASPSCSLQLPWQSSLWGFPSLRHYPSPAYHRKRVCLIVSPFSPFFNPLVSCPHCSWSFCARTTPFRVSLGSSFPLVWCTHFT